MSRGSTSLVVQIMRDRSCRTKTMPTLECKHKKSASDSPMHQQKRQQGFQSQQQQRFFQVKISSSTSIKLQGREIGEMCMYRNGEDMRCSIGSNAKWNGMGLRDGRPADARALLGGQHSRWASPSKSHRLRESAKIRGGRLRLDAFDAWMQGARPRFNVNNH